MSLTTRRNLLRRVHQARGVLVAPVILVAGWQAWIAGGRLVGWELGGPLFLVGWAGRVWAQQHLGYRLSQRMRLTTCGPYARVRNPIYLGNAAIVAGTVVASGAFWLLPVAVVVCGVVYALAVRHEEASLARTYGARYRTYAAAVPQWLPRRTRHGSRCACAPPWGGLVAAEAQVPLVLLPVVIPLVVRALA